MVIITEKFKPSPSLYTCILMRRWLVNNLWWLIMPVTLFLGLGIFLNASYFYVALIYLFCVAPMSQALVYFNYVLHPDTIVNIFEQQWRFSEQSAAVTYYPTVTVHDETVNPLTDSSVVDAAKITRVNISGGNLVMTLNNDYKIYVIPLSSLTAPDDLSKIFKFYETVY